jgi:asparagine synthase (glutamine-hydrolysing)
MCAIAGFLGKNQEEILRQMTDTISHRGPDDSGAWSDVERGVHLGHRRLAILDLSQAGHQPMSSPSGRYVIVFNGEIYNHLKLREKLTSAWRGHSDTETLLAGFDAWGIQKTVEETQGMFAFAVWDKKELTLTLGRDRLGEKPLYYG